MKLLDVVREVRRHLEENGRVSLRMLRRQYELDDEALDELIEELVDVQRIARREENVLVWSGAEHGVRSQVSGLGTGPDTQHPTPDTGSETRKVISVIFADLMGSTALQEGLDPESVNRVMDAYYHAVRGPVEAAGGTVVQLLGDGVLCAFGIPRIAEDDALRAAVGIQQAFREFLSAQQWLRVPIGLRVAVNTGEVVVSEEHPAGIGDPLNVAARLQQEARDGEVVIGQATRRLVADAVTLEQAGVFALKGRAETVTAYRVVSLERPTGAATAPFVGRDNELARITAVYEAAHATPAARLAVVVGSPGLGKSRLIAEVARRLGNAASVVMAQCDAAGSATFAPVAEALRTWLRNRSDPSDPTDPSDLQSALAAALPSAAADRDRIITGITALLAGSPASPEETFFVIRRLLTALAQIKPVVLVIDDLQWAEPLLLDLVEHLIQWGSGVPLFVLIGARPELRELRSSLVTPANLVSDVVTLSGLDAGAATRLAANVIGASDLPAAVAAKVLATSEGNPLFVGELVRMLVDEGAIERQGERWVVGANLAALEMPPTIHALLAARIERLRPDDRTVLERAAVVGRHFSRGAVAALLSRNGTGSRSVALSEGSELDARLEALRRTEVIEPDTGWFLGEPVLRFHHVLIRDAAYRRLLKGTRAELHAKLADWIQAQVGGADDHDETIGWHLEQAHQHLRELGPIDAKGRELGERAAQRLAAAGRRALARDDLPVAANLLGRAIDRLDSDDTTRAELALDWCEALLAAGDVGPAANAIAELARFAGANDRTDRSDPSDRSDSPGARLRAWHTCFTSQLTVLTAPQGLQAAADDVAEAARQLAAQGDAAGEAKAHSVHAQALARLGKVGAAEAALDQALAAARKAGDRRRANAVLAGAPLAALWGPSPVTRASGRCLDVVRVLRITQGAPAVESVALSCQGVLEALRGRTEAARRMLASARKMVEELGIANRLFEADAFAGRIAMMEGDTATAERLLRGAHEGLRDLGLGIDAARAGTLLAQTLLAQDRVGEAEALSHESEELAGDDLQAAIAWRGVRAEALAKRGEHSAAIELATAAVAIASATDALLDHADARVALATALRAGGRATEADTEARHAIELWEAKGATLLAERARQAPRTTGAPPPPLVRPPLRAEESTEGTHGRVLPNRASRVIAAIDTAFAACDMEAVDAMLRADHEEFDHRTGATWDREGVLASVRMFMRSRDPEFRNLPLATLGDALVLTRRWVSAAATAGGRFDVGEYESEAICILECDERGQFRRQEVFATDRLGDAIVRLYARYAELLPDTPSPGDVGEHAASASARAAVTARALAYILTTSDTPDESLLFSPTYDDIDHRSVGYGTLSTDAARKLVVTQHAIADGLRFRVEDVLALRPDGLVRRSTTLGTWRDGGGAFERTVCMLSVFGPDGRVVRQETFDSDREAEALARFDELCAGAAPGERSALFANTASRTNERLTSCWAARDWGGILALLSPALRMDDRRRLMRLEIGFEDFVAQFRMLFDQPGSRWHEPLLATRGDRLSLHRTTFQAEVEGGGPLSIDDHLSLIEADANARCIAVVAFDLDDEDAAYAALDARYYAGEAAAYPAHGAIMRAFTRAVVSREWDPVLALCAPEFIEHDHRRLAVLGTTRGAAAWVQNFSTLVDLAPDTVYRVDHLRSTAHGFCSAGTWVGSRDGGRYEIPLIAILELDGRDRLARADIYDADQLDQAMARFAELAGDKWEGEAPAEPWVATGGGSAGASPSPVRSTAPFANAATASSAPVIQCLIAHDWAGFRELFAEDFHMSDRRRVVQLELDRDQYVAFTREVADGRTIRNRWELVATRGERLALTRAFYEFADADVGPSEIAFLLLMEVDERGRIVANVRWDLDDLDGAYAELDTRWVQGEAGAHPTASKWLADYLRVFASRDWSAMSALFAPEVIGENHRLVGWGTRTGPAGIVSTLQAQIELAPDTRERVDHVRTCAGALLFEYAWHGTHEGGTFENLWVVLIELDADRRARRVDVWEPEQLEQARARFDEIERGRPLAAITKDHAATAWLDRMRVFDSGDVSAADWDELRASCAPGMIFEDRQGFARLSGDREMMLASLRERVASGARSERQLLGTAGARVAIMRMLWAGGPADGRFEIEYLSVVEIDAAGLVVAIILFAPDDERAAQREAWARWARIDPAAAPWPT